MTTTGDARPGNALVAQPAPTPYTPDNPHRTNVLISGTIAIIACAGVVVSHTYDPEHLPVATVGPLTAVLINMYFQVRHHLHIELPPTTIKDRP